MCNSRIFLFSCLCVCVAYMKVHVIYACVHVHVCVGIKAKDWLLIFSSMTSHRICLKQGLSGKEELIVLTRLDSQWALGIFLAPLPMGFEMCTTSLSLYLGTWDLNPSPLACAQSTIPANPSLQAHILNMKNPRDYSIPRDRARVLPYCGQTQMLKPVTPELGESWNKKNIISNRDSNWMITGDWTSALTLGNGSHKACWFCVFWRSHFFQSGSQLLCVHVYGPNWWLLHSSGS